MNKIIITCIIIIILILIIIVSIPWQGHHAFSLANNAKNIMYKAKHSLLNVPLDKCICAANLSDFKYAMGSIPFWLSEGTALGIIREGDFISHDDDVDVGMWIHDLDKFNKDALPRLINLGFTLDFDRFNGTFIGLSRHG